MSSQLLEDPVFRGRLRRHAEVIFFEAMQAGYAGRQVQRTTVPQLVGSKHIIYERDEWRVTDTWITTPQGDGSGGMTIISYDGDPIWMMQYGGHYPESAIDFLKEALRKNYNEGVWFGGRGPHFYEKDGWAYVNVCPGGWKFGDGFGFETISHATTGGVVGQHRYQAFWLMRD